ncbi:LysM peptidoglycan-binding domain-containing protein [Roseomonas populi]|uniref:LysM peptidoglycan-binding domain-containing protein n=1 Tax=Roseomonas populi TaxID=3121582 RepID=A0ABT1WYF6_9PROT|nr:LysM peptidoglycan-binding domain-containing protein [Roseomonas pecuniae]MCR0980878.1 LysM peptidoglycan-binding domain-containing protein [Roseomonas pecuniae]
MTDASRLRVVGGATVLAGALAAGAFYGTRDRAAAPTTRPVASAPRAAEAPRRDASAQDRPVETRQAVSQAGAATPSSPAPEARPARSAEPPRFDVVRMGARGMVVVAGRAAPGAEVLLLEGGREIGRARADARGEWVILPSEPLGAGARELSLRARLPGGDEVAGPDSVVVVGPAPAEPQVAAAEPGEERLAPRPAGRQPEATRPREETRVAEAAPQRSAGAPQGRAATGTAEDRPEPPKTQPTGTTSADVAPAKAEQTLVLLLPPTAEAAPRQLAGPARAAPNTPLGLDVVDYDDSNTMRFAGTAPPGARLRVYADNRHLGDTSADPEGRWSLTPAETPQIGRHTLRVDQLGTTAAEGAAPVAGRIEVAFQRESLPPGLVRDGKVVVQPGHNLWRIARDAYGRGVRYTVIYRANQAQIRHPARIYPGQVFAVPEAR